MDKSCGAASPLRRPRTLREALTISEAKYVVTTIEKASWIA
jgi:hypothetical protein